MPTLLAAIALWFLQLVSPPSVDGQVAGAPAPRDDDASSAAPGDSQGAECALGAVCLGPVVDLGLANPLGFGVHTRVGRHLGFGIDYQFLPEVTIESATVSASLFTIDARVYPRGDSLFLSAGFAYQALSAIASAGLTDDLGRRHAIAVRGSLSIPMIKLGVGFFGRAGFVLGCDLALGVRLENNGVRLAATYVGLPASVVAEAAALEGEARQRAQSAVDSVLDTMPLLIQLNVLRVGYAF